MHSALRGLALRAVAAPPCKPAAPVCRTLGFKSLPRRGFYWRRASSGLLALRSRRGRDALGPAGPRPPGGGCATVQTGCAGLSNPWVQILSPTRLLLGARERRLTGLEVEEREGFTRPLRGLALRAASPC